MFEKIACNSKCKLTCKSQKTLSALCLSLCHVQLLGPNPLCLSKLSLFCISIIFFFFLPLIRVNCIIQSCYSLCLGNFIFMNLLWQEMHDYSMWKFLGQGLNPCQAATQATSVATLDL